MRAYRLIWPVVALLICGLLAFNSGCGSGELDDLGDWGIAIEDLESLPPDVLFTAEAHDPDNDLSVRFTAEAIDGTRLAPDSVTWTFGDGGMNTGTTVFHTYVAEGDYMVQAQASYQQTATAKAKNFLVHVRRFKVQVSAQPSQGQVPLATQLNGQATLPTGHSAETYLWDFGDGEMAEGSLEVTHTFVEPGQYPVELTVISNRGWQRTGRISVEGLLDNLPPLAVIEADPLSGWAPLTVLFDGGQSSDPDGDPIISYDWEFGDGQTAEGEAVENIYQVRGDYQARLTVTDARGGSSTAEVTVAVDGPNQAPTACMEAVPTSGTAPLQVTFRAQCSSDDDGSIQSYNWDFGDGVSTGGIEVTHTYQGPGDYTATLMVIDNEGGTDSVAVTIDVNDGPSASFVVTPASIDFGDSGSDEPLQISNTGGVDLAYNVSIDYGGGPGGWLAVDPDSGTCPAGESDTVTVTDSRDLLEPGSHSAVINVTASSVTKAVGVSIAVVAVATSVDSHDFGSMSSVYELDVWNAGAGTLVFEVASKPAWLSVEGVPATSSGPADVKTITVTVDRSGLAMGTYADQLVIAPTSGQGDHDARVAVTMEVAVGPVSVSPSQLDFGSSVVEMTFEVWNSGGGTLSYTIDDDADWLSVSPTSGDSSGEHDTITATVDRSGLADDSYATPITVTPSVGSPELVAVTMTVGSSMTTASRTSGVAPLGVFFDAIDTVDPQWSSAVVQPRGFVAQPVNCSSVRITRVNYHTGAGSGVLRFTRGTTCLTWAAPGETAGTPVDVSGGGNFALVSGGGDATLHVWLDPAALPGADAEDTIDIQIGGDNADWNSFHHAWDFGDPGSGNWLTGATRSDGSYPSKNVAYGWIAAHVYEQPGPYTVTLTITDDTDGTHVYTQDVTVEAEPPGGWTTYYFAADGNDLSGDGSEANPYQTFDTAMSLVGDNVKLLFKRDDTFVVNNTGRPSTTGPLYVGAYGSGERPRFTIPGVSIFMHGLYLENARFVDLWVDGELPPDVRPDDAFLSPGKNTLILRTRTQDMERGFGLTWKSCVIVQECESFNDMVSVWVEGNPQAAILGCAITDGNTVFVEASLRTYTDKLIVSHSLFERPNEKFGIRFMSGDQAGLRGRWNICSFNNFVDSAITASGEFDTQQPMHLLISDNELHMPTLSACYAIHVNGIEWLMVRNNRYYTPHGNTFINLYNDYKGRTFYYHVVRVYNNVMYCGSTVWVKFMWVHDSVTEVSSALIVKNNVLHAPNVGSTENRYCIRLDSDAFGPFLESDYNLWYVPLDMDPFEDSTGPLTLEQWRAAGKDLNSITSDPQLVGPASGDLRLQPSSPCIDAGTNDTLPWCRIDATGQVRTEGRVNIGAYE